MIRRPPRSTRTDTLFPYTTLFRSADKRLRLPALTGAVAWPSWADHEIVVAGAHRARISGRMAAAIRAGIDFTQFSESAAGRLILRADKKSAPNQPHGPPPTAVLSIGSASCRGRVWQYV